MTKLLFDANNLGMRCVHVGGAIEGNEFNFQIWEHLVFKSIYTALFNRTIGPVEEVIVAIDERSWRKHIWKRYKSHRKVKRDKSPYNWKEYFAHFDKYLLRDLKETFPFKIMKIQSAEADDVLGVFVHNIPGDYTIVSADKDYLQLCDKAKIYNPIKKKMLKCPDTEYFLQEQCIIGQKKDNIYNIKTALDKPEEERWKPCGEKTAKKIIDGGLEDWLVAQGKVDHYKLNRKLMDFTLIPQVIVDRVKEEYYNYKLPVPDKMYDFFKQRNWPNFIENFHSVEQKLLTLH